MFDFAVLATEAGVQPGAISLAGLAVGGGGILLAAAWLHYVYR